MGKYLLLILYFVISYYGRPYYHGAVAALISMLPQGFLYKLYIGPADQAGVPSILCTAPCVSAIHDHESLELYK